MFESPRTTPGKTAASKTLKEKRTAKADKRAASDRAAQNTDAVTKATKR